MDVVVIRRPRAPRAPDYYLARGLARESRGASVQDSWDDPGAGVKLKIKFDVTGENG
jgi:hypothetical protein